jgi:hypothetical protein
MLQATGSRRALRRPRAANFNHNKPYAIGSFSAGKFVLDTSGFTDTLSTGNFFSVSTSNGGSELDLNYLPEPTCSGLVAAGAVGDAVGAKHRR